MLYIILECIKLFVWLSLLVVLIYFVVDMYIHGDDP